VGRVHRAGLKALLDFVPNHVARGYHWTFLIGQARQRDANAFFFAEAYAYPFAGSGDPVTSIDREGRRDVSVATVNAGRLTSDGFPVSASNQSAYVYALTGS